MLVTTSDASGIKEVIMAYTDGKGTWNGSFAANTEKEFIFQISYTTSPDSSQYLKLLKR